ncbi:hypothetical protein LTR85_011844 [Meristemomyces frigidus]|nr:hypothetical protein LTR85_011844 [Meristemomyces frigidus]
MASSGTLTSEELPVPTEEFLDFINWDGEEDGVEGKTAQSSTNSYDHFDGSQQSQHEGMEAEAPDACQFADQIEPFVTPDYSDIPQVGDREAELVAATGAGLQEQAQWADGDLRTGISGAPLPQEARGYFMGQEGVMYAPGFVVTEAAEVPERSRAAVDHIQRAETSFPQVALDSNASCSHPCEIPSRGAAMMPANSGSQKHHAAAAPVRQRVRAKASGSILCDHPACDKITKLYTQGELNKHQLRKHGPEEDRRYPCLKPDCFKRFLYPKDLKRHNKDVHLPKDLYHCPESGCGKTFARHYGRARHMGSAHPTVVFPKADDRCVPIPAMQTAATVGSDSTSSIVALPSPRTPSRRTIAVVNDNERNLDPQLRPKRRTGLPTPTSSDMTDLLSFIMPLHILTGKEVVLVLCVMGSKATRRFWED